VKSYRHIIHESGVQEGLALVFPLHTTAAVFINDSDPSVTEDILDVLEQTAPSGGAYRHDRVDPKHNAHGHIKGTLLGHHICLPISEGQLESSNPQW